MANPNLGHLIAMAQAMGPPFRWFWNRMQLDLVPLDEKVLGFANPWLPGRL